MDNKVNKIIKSESQFYYRNKVEFSFTHNRWLLEDEIKGDKSIKDRRGVGFHLSGMWNKVVDIQECFLQSDPSNKIRTYLKSFAIKNEIPIIPTAVIGTKGIIEKIKSFKREKVKIVFGKPIFVKNGDKEKVITRRVMNSLKEMFVSLGLLLFALVRHRTAMFGPMRAQEVYVSYFEAM